MHDRNHPLPGPSIGRMNFVHRSIIEFEIVFQILDVPSLHEIAGCF